MNEKTLWLKKTKLVAVFGLPFLWAILLFIFLNLTSPLKSGPLSVLVTFVLIYLLVSSVLFAVAFCWSKLASFLGWRATLRTRTLYYLVSVISLGPVFILALNTLGRLEVKEAILVLILLILGCFYVLRRDRKETL